MSHGPQKAWLLSVPAPAQQDLWRVSPPAWPTELSGPTLKSPQKPLENMAITALLQEREKKKPKTTQKARQALIGHEVGPAVPATSLGYSCQPRLQKSSKYLTCHL